MRRLIAATAASVVVFGAAAPAWPRTLGAADAGSPGLLQAAAAAETTTATFTGLLQLTLDIDVVSVLVDSPPIMCTMTAYVIGGEATYTETATATATRSGAKATCIMKLPYQWILPGTGELVSLTYMIDAVDKAGNGRTSSTNFSYIAVPKSGATTRYTLAARI